MENIPVAQYLRVSTERQEYSLDFQSAGIAAYALVHGFQVCQTYRDEAKSGLDLARRKGLSCLLQDVVGGRQIYKAILVYDVSRWGRFQDPDEAAHYEFVCKEAGIKVHYCAELFSNDGDFSSTILKALKRVMAGEYSRELSQKVHAGLVRLVRRGFHSGSPPGYGFRRMLVAPDGSRKQKLVSGERKSIATDRVILIPGPQEEVFWVREIYRLFTHEGKSFAEIAAYLDDRKAPYLAGGTWNDYGVKKILTHPKYKGTAVFNRTTEKLNSGSRKLPESEWIIVPNAFEALVSEDVFAAAQDIFRRKSWNQSNEQLLEQMKAIVKTDGYLSASVLKRHGLTATTLAYRFGSVIRAYELIGYETHFRKISEGRLSGSKARIELMQKLADLFPGRISIVSGAYRNRKHWITIVNGPQVAVRICRTIHLKRNGRRWMLQASKNEHFPVTLMAGMNAENTALETFYVTGILTNRSKLHLTENSEWLKNGTRLAGLSSFYEVAMSRI